MRLPKLCWFANNRQIKGKGFKFCFLLSVFLLFPGEPFANPVEGPKIACHLTGHGFAKNCQAAPRPPCNEGEANFLVSGNLQVSYDVYILVADGDSSAGVSGACFGIAYDGQSQSGLDIFSWSLCAEAEFRGGPTGVNWPESGSGNLIVWASDKCQKTPALGDESYGVTTILGSLYVYAYSPDSFAIGPRQYVSPPDLAVGTCLATEVNLSFPAATGAASFGMSGSHDPCQ